MRLKISPNLLLEMWPNINIEMIMQERIINVQSIFYMCMFYDINGVSALIARHVLL